ncbi:MAG: transposase [Sedimentisphaerales bacterium]|nr:transposase [Sedimentisphaerales bacterium]MBN2842091.1 transposase [Sedimentisphaerales bacterium]
MKDIFYNPDFATERNRRHLPHWQQNEKFYFVTFRLADSIPVENLFRLECQQKEFLRTNFRPFTANQEQQYQHLFFEKINGWLDNCYGECLLERADIASIVKDAIFYYNDNKYQLDHWVIMPNHVHVLLLLNGDIKIQSVTHSWKSYTGLQINKLVGKTGSLWQSESFDHIVRSQFYLDKYRNYIVSNKERVGSRAMLSTETIV